MKKRKSKIHRRLRASRKLEAVLRLLRGEPVDEVSRGIGRPIQVLESWRQDFIEGGMLGLKSRKDDLAGKRLRDAQAKIGDSAMRLELAEMLLEKRGFMQDAEKLRRPLA